MSYENISIEDAIEELIDYRGKTPPKSDSGIKLITAKVIKEGRILNGNHEYITEETYQDWMSRGYPKIFDVLITTEAPLGEVAQIKTEEKIALAQRVILLRANNNKVDPNYLYQALKSPISQARLEARGTGTTVLGISQKELRKVEIPYHGLKTQQKIASILSAFDDLIENNIRRIAILEEMARLIYREWFVHYRYPGHEKDELVGSGTEFGKVPDGWKILQLDDFIDFKNGKSAKNQEGNAFPVYGANGIIGKCDVGKWENGVIIGRVGAYCGEVEYCESKFWASDNTIVATPTKDYKFPLFVYYKLEDLQLRRYAGGSAQPLMTQTVIKEIPTIVPSKELLARFEAIVDDLWKSKRNLEKKNQKLKETRDLILPRLISNEINL